MQNIKIKYSYIDFDCECCGWSNGMHYAVFKDKEMWLSGYADNHLSPGPDSLEKLYLVILEKLGYNIEEEENLEINNLSELDEISD